MFIYFTLKFLNIIFFGQVPYNNRIISLLKSKHRKHFSFKKVCLRQLTVNPVSNNKETCKTVKIVMINGLA